MAPIEPGAKSLFQFLHEAGKITDTSAVSIEGLFFPVRIRGCGCTVHLQSSVFGESGAMQPFETIKDRLSVKREPNSGIGHLEEEVKVVGHHTEGEGADAVKFLKLLKEAHKMIFLNRSEQALATYDSGDTVVVAEVIHFQSWCSHSIGCSELG